MIQNQIINKLMIEAGIKNENVKHTKIARVGEWTKGKGGFIDGKWLARDMNLHTNDGYKLIECPTE